MGVVIEKLAPRVWNMLASIDSHFTQQLSLCKRHHPEKLDAHVPEFAGLSVSIDCHNLKTLSANEREERR